MRGKGFTLIELLVTISILAILMTIAMISYGEVQKNMRDNKRKADLATIQSALEQYHADQGYYPAIITADLPLTNSIVTKTYLLKVPKDTKTNLPYSYTATPSSCNNVATRCVNYCLYATVENPANASPTATPICSALGIVVASHYQTQAP